MANTLRVKSIKDLGKGAWKISDSNNPSISSPSPIKKNRLASVSASQLPQHKLWISVKQRWPSICVWEYENAIPNRKFRIDIAFPSIKLAIECDGWSSHGRHKAGFIKDRTRQNLFVIHGWRVLRFTAGQIFKEHDSCMEQIQQAIDNS